MQHFGKAGKFFYQIVRGIDERNVEPHRETKSIGSEDTFAEDLFDINSMLHEVEKLADKVTRRLLHHGLKGKTITLKVKYNDFKLITRSQSLDVLTDDKSIIIQTTAALLQTLHPFDKGVRLLGVSVSNFRSPAADPGDAPYMQLQLF